MAVKARGHVDVDVCVYNSSDGWMKLQEEGFGGSSESNGAQLFARERSELVVWVRQVHV